MFNYFGYAPTDMISSAKKMFLDTVTKQCLLQQDFFSYCKKKFLCQEKKCGKKKISISSNVFLVSKKISVSDLEVQKV